MEGGIERRRWRRRREGRRRTGSSASRLSYGQWISWGNWLKVSLCLYCYSWLSGSVLCCVSRVICQVCREERQREREGGETTPVAGRQQLPACCWLGVLTPHLTSMGTEQPPLLPSPPGRLWEQGVGGADLHFNLPLFASRRAVELWEAALDRAGHDMDSFGSETPSGDSEDCSAD